MKIFTPVPQVHVCVRAWPRSPPKLLGMATHGLVPALGSKDKRGIWSSLLRLGTVMDGSNPENSPQACYKTKETSLLAKDRGSDSDPESTEINNLPTSGTLKITGLHTGKRQRRKACATAGRARVTRPASRAHPIPPCLGVKVKKGPWVLSYTILSSITS